MLMFHDGNDAQLYKLLHQPSLPLQHQPLHHYPESPAGPSAGAWCEEGAAGLQVVILWWCLVCHLLCGKCCWEPLQYLVVLFQGWVKLTIARWQGACLPFWWSELISPSGIQFLRVLFLTQYASHWFLMSFRGRKNIINYPYDKMTMINLILGEREREK